jgi:hypothetical protein
VAMSSQLPLSWGGWPGHRGSQSAPGVPLRPGHRAAGQDRSPRCRRTGPLWRRAASAGHPTAQCGGAEARRLGRAPPRAW